MGGCRTRKFHNYTHACMCAQNEPHTDRQIDLCEELDISAIYTLLIYLCAKKTKSELHEILQPRICPYGIRCASLYTTSCTPDHSFVSTLNLLALALSLMMPTWRWLLDALCGASVSIVASLVLLRTMSYALLIFRKGLPRISGMRS